MKKTTALFLSSFIVLALLTIGKSGAFKNPLMGAVIIILILLAFPIVWHLRRYIKNKNPQVIASTKCPFCGFEISEGTTICPNCGNDREDDFFEDKDEFTEDLQVKKICPYCGLNELETVYEISRGYKEVCASCGKSRVSRKAIKITLKMIGFLVALMLLFYWIIQNSLK